MDAKSWRLVFAFGGLCMVLGVVFAMVGGQQGNRALSGWAFMMVVVGFGAAVIGRFGSWYCGGR